MPETSSAPPSSRGVGPRLRSVDAQVPTAPADIRPTRIGLPAAFGKRRTAGAALLTYLAAQVDRLVDEERRVRADEPDAVHQMRVAARRLRSALRAYRQLLDRDVTDPLGDGLRELGRALAPARDAEVLRDRICTGLDELAPELVLGPAQAAVVRHFARIEADARAAALAELDGERHAALRAELDALLAHPPLTPRARRKARSELPRLARRTARRLEKAVAAVDDAGDPADRDAALHTARKRARRMRYATEVARPVVGKPAKRFAREMKGIQRALGEHQDAVVARGALRELGAQSHESGENGFSFGVLLGRDAAHAERIRDDLPALWAAAWTRKNRSWLR